ncbi:MAG: AAA family ATPase [Candidatus Hydrogenedentes bacterium]|nr:AAA family ATPase [Candidatus Hydrogenedentota bacterium]
MTGIGGLHVVHEVQSYLGALGFHEQPFAPTADPTYFYSTRENKSCLYRLWSNIDERHGIAVVLGNYGTGKTTLLRKLMTGMAAEPKLYNTAVVGSPIPSWTSFSLLEAIVKQFGLRPSTRSFAAYMESLNQYLLANRHRISTLIIDDAQNLNKRGQLELLRLVQNLETSQHKLLNLVLFAQLEWEHVLRAAPNFAQRINMTYTLPPLRIEEIQAFIEFRMAQASTQRRRVKFDENALRIIHAYSEGNPRLVVTTCRNALLLAARMGSATITGDIVLHTIEKTTLHDPKKHARAKTANVQPAFTLKDAKSPLSKVRATQFSRRDVPAMTASRSRDRRANEMLLRAARTKTRSRG